MLGLVEMEEKILAQFQMKSREPFQELLATILQCKPSVEALKAHAEKSPDRWSQTLSIVAKLAGYNDKLEIEGSLVARAVSMSDAELDLLIAQQVETLLREKEVLSLASPANTPVV